MNPKHVGALTNYGCLKYMAFNEYAEAEDLCRHDAPPPVQHACPATMNVNEHAGAIAQLATQLPKTSTTNNPSCPCFVDTVHVQHSMTMHMLERDTGARCEWIPCACWRACSSTWCARCGVQPKIENIRAPHTCSSMLHIEACAPQVPDKLSGTTPRQCPLMGTESKAETAQAADHRPGH
jgi:hypothetical protein